MANLNLSEFTEKLFVADADHTFIWDTAGAISKRVSRNSWLNSGTLTSDAPVTISQTWNNAAVAFTGLKVNAAGTSDANSASGSLLADFQVGGVSKFTVRKDGAIVLPFNYAGIVDGSNNSGGTNYTWGGPRFGPAAFIAWTAGAPTSTADTILLRDAANTLALRNGATAQTFNVYGTYTSGTSYERLTLSAPSAANAIIGTNKGSGGGTARGLDLHTDGAARMTISTAGNVGIGTTAPGAKLQVVGNAIFGENVASGSTTPLNVSFGGSYGTNTPGVKGNLKWDLYRDESGGRSGIGISGGLMEFQGGTGVAFGFYPNNGTTSALRISSDLNVGIGTTSPTSKLQVTGGDVEIETVTSGIIMKAAGTATRYRITLNAGGTDLVFTAI